MPSIYPKKPTGISVVRNYLKIGSVASVNHGPNYGQAVVVLNIIDSKRVLVEGKGFKRQSIAIADLSLLNIAMDIPKNLRQSKLKKKYESNKIEDQIKNSSLYKLKAFREKRASLSDFDRFKVQKARQSRARVVRGGVRKATKGKVAAGGKAAGGKK